MENRKPLIKIGAGVLVFLLLLWLNPIAFNNAGERTVVTTFGGDQFVRFEAGTYWQGFFAKEMVWPNQISVSYKDTLAPTKAEMEDNNIEIGQVQIRFNDATTAKIAGITQYILPTIDSVMLDMHNAHKTPEALVVRRLAPYTIECLQSSAQQMSSEMHYSGGRAQMVQDYLDQLKNGAFLLRVAQKVVYDSIEKSNKRIYEVESKLDKNGIAMRKFSSIKEYGLTVSDAQVTDVDYQAQVDSMLSKKIAAATRASISKQELMTAQQQALTAKAKGEQALVEIEYKQKQEQTRQVVAAETTVKLAEQDLEKQSIAEKAAYKEASKIKILADANAYEKQRDIQANGALEQKLDAYITVQKYWADAFKGYVGNIVPLYQSGGVSSQNGAVNFMEILGAKAARDLTLDLKTK